MKDTAIKLFEQNHVRSIWNEKDGKWYFSVVDIKVNKFSAGNSIQYPNGTVKK